MLKRIFINIGIVAVAVFLLDFAIGNTLKHYYFKETSGLHYRTTYSIDSTKADILVFGSSRANHHYVPEIFEDSLHMSFYNTGRDGNSILYSLAVFKSVIKRYTPKIVIIDLMPSELNYNLKNYDRLSCLQPYYFDHPEIQSIINLRGPYEKYKLLSVIYPYNSSLLAIIIGNMEINKKRKGDRKGYLPIYNCIEDTILTGFENIPSHLDTINIEALKYISNVCYTKNIHLFFVQSPLFAKVPPSLSTDLIVRIANEDNAFFLNYINDTIFLDHPLFFSDQSHLNDNGAKLFSGILVSKIIRNRTNKSNNMLESKSNR